MTNLAPIRAIFVVVFLASTAGAEEFNASFIQVREFSTGPFCTYKHHESGRMFVGKVPESGCPQQTNIRDDLLGKYETPVFSLFSEVDFLPVEPEITDQYFNNRPQIADYRFGTVDIAEYEALVSQLNRCGAFHVDIMGLPFVFTHDTNNGSLISGKAGIKGDASLRAYYFSCNRPKGRGPECVIVCEKNCTDGTDMFVIEAIADTPYSAMYRGVIQR